MRGFHRTQLGGSFSEGARLLWIALGGFDRQVAAAEDLGCMKSTLSRWLYGDRRPESHWRSVLKKRFRIPYESWETPPKRLFVPPAARAASAA